MTLAALAWCSDKKFDITKTRPLFEGLVFSPFIIMMRLLPLP